MSDGSQYYDQVDEIVLGLVPQAVIDAAWEAAECDDTLAELLREAAELYDAVAEVAPVASPPETVKERLLGNLDAPRHGRFAELVARLLDVGQDVALGLLAGIDVAANWVASPWQDVTLYHLEGGPVAANAIVGFVRIAPGAEFPDHEHLGDETVLIVQGHCHDSVGQVRRPGDIVEMPPGTSHALTVPADGPELIYLARVYGGITAGELTLRAGDPDI